MCGGGDEQAIWILSNRTSVRGTCALCSVALADNGTDEVYFESGGFLMTFEVVEIVADSVVPLRR